MQSDPKPRYIANLGGKWCYRPSPAMKAAGFRFYTFGKEWTREAFVQAETWNQEWDRSREGIATPPLMGYAYGTIGHAFHRALKLRAKEREDAGRPPPTAEQAARDDWTRAWKYLKPLFADLNPKAITSEQLQEARTDVKVKYSNGEAHRMIKVWRTLWNIMEAFGYCSDKNGAATDPSAAFKNPSPPPRQKSWRFWEIAMIVQRAWREGYYGIAAAIAVGWDTGLSPIDVRGLTLSKLVRNEHGLYFDVGRAKTGRAAVGTLTPWSEALLKQYLKKLGFKLGPDAPLFLTRGFKEEARMGSARELIVAELLQFYPRAIPRMHLLRCAKRKSVSASAVDDALYNMRQGGVVVRLSEGQYALKNPPTIELMKPVVVQNNVPPAPYTTNSLGCDFRILRELVFPGELRQFADMRRSGAVEADAGGASPAVLANKMANTLDRNARLRGTYNPVNVPSVRVADAARLVGRKRLDVDTMEVGEKALW